VSFGTFVAIRKVLSNVIELFPMEGRAQILVVLHRLRLSEDVSIDVLKRSRKISTCDSEFCERVNERVNGRLEC
jgi:hypothetical protein